jgi:hypothetical protein
MHPAVIIFKFECVTLETGLDPNLREPVFFAAATTQERYPKVPVAGKFWNCDYFGLLFCIVFAFFRVDAHSPAACKDAQRNF